jgi:hypothetical protein
MKNPKQKSNLNQYKNKNKNKNKNNNNIITKTNKANKLPAIITKNPTATAEIQNSKMVKLAFYKHQQQVHQDFTKYQKHQTIIQRTTYHTLVNQQNQVKIKLNDNEVQTMLVYVSVIFAQEQEYSIDVTIENNKITRTYPLTTATRIFKITNCDPTTLTLSKIGQQPAIMMVTRRLTIKENNIKNSKIIFSESLLQDISNNKSDNEQEEEEEEEEEEQEEQQEQHDEDSIDSNYTDKNSDILPNKDIQALPLTKLVLQSSQYKPISKLTSNDKNKIVIAYNNKDQRIKLYYTYDGKQTPPKNYKILELTDLQGLNLANASLITTEQIGQTTLNEFKATVQLQ